MLVLDDVSVEIAGTTVLRNVSARLSAGSLVAVVGRNGAGKTTLLRTTMGLIKLKRGRILFDDDELQDLPAHWRAEQGIGYAPEDRVIFPTLTVEENMRLPCEAHGLPDKDIDERLTGVLEVVPQLKDMLQRSGAALSGGQGKMVALGRALMAGTRLVLLDEPFQGLAPVLAVQYGEALGRLRKVRPDLAVLITESNASLLGDIPDQVWTLERGVLSSEDKVTAHQLRTAVREEDVYRWLALEEMSTTKTVIHYHGLQDLHLQGQSNFDLPNALRREHAEPTMKVTMEIDCTPSEARRFFGLPDLEPIQEAVMKRLEEQMLEQTAKLSPEGLLKSWLSAGAFSAENMQDLMTGAFRRASDPKVR